jgi:hypothetical protein
MVAFRLDGRIAERATPHPYAILERDLKVGDPPVELVGARRISPAHQQAPAPKLCQHQNGREQLGRSPVPEPADDL